MPYYLCRVIGTGTEDDPRRPYVSNYDYQGISWVVAMEDTGTGKGCLVYLPRTTPEIENDNAIKRISKQSLDDYYTSVEFDRLKIILANHGITNTTEINHTNFNLMQIIAWTGKKIGNFPQFNLDNFHVL